VSEERGTPDGSGSASGRGPTLAFLALAALYAHAFGVTHAALEEWWQATFERLVGGDAMTPMQYRVLLPWLAGRVVASLRRTPFEVTLAQVRLAIEVGSVFALLLAVFLVAPSWLRRGGATAAAAAPGGPGAWAAGLLTALALPFHYLLVDESRVFYTYDIPGILFFALSLAAARAERWALFYPLFVLATFNRETSFFLIVVVLLTGAGRWPRRRLLRHLFALAALWVAAKGALWVAFQQNTDLHYSNASGLLKNTLGDNLAAAGDLRTWLLLPAVYGYLWIPLLVFRRRLADPWLRRALLAVPLFHLVMLVPGEILELRIYADMLPLVVLGLVGAVAGGAPPANDRPSPGLPGGQGASA